MTQYMVFLRIDETEEFATIGLQRINHMGTCGRK